MPNYRITDKDLDEHGHLIQQYPEKIDGSFDCAFTNILSLAGVPQIISGNFRCYYTKITSLEYGPQWIGESFSVNNTKITSLEYAPQYIGGSVFCPNSKITSLEGIGKRYLKEIGRSLTLDECPIQSNMLGLMLVKDLKTIYFNTNNQIEEIFNRHLQGYRDILECQEELIDKGFKEFAKL